MQIFKKEALHELIQKYKTDACETTNLSCVYERDFVNDIRNCYFENDVLRVLVVSGFKATGKTTGLLQAIENYDDALYITASKNEDETGTDYINLLKNTSEKYIVIDEYSWIKDRNELDYYLYTLVENGKRIAVTGTDSMALDYLNNGSLIHRILYVNVNLFTYQEYCRIYQKEYGKKSSDEFIRAGSFFTEYAAENFVTMTKYIEEAIVKNYANLIGISEEKAKAVIYDIIYLAVCPSTTSEAIYPHSRKKDIRYQTMLSRFGIDPLIELTPFDFKTACDVLEKTGFIVKTHNLLDLREDLFRLNLTNPSLTYQMISNVFDSISAEDKKGYAYEAYTVAYVSNNLDLDELYYIDMGKDKPEIEIAILDPHEKALYLMDAKETSKRRLSSNKSLVSDILEEELTENTALTIEGRFVISNSDFEEASEHNGKKVIFTQLESDTLLLYSKFNELYDSIQAKRRYRSPNPNLKNKKDNIEYGDT